MIMRRSGQERAPSEPRSFERVGKVAKRPKGDGLPGDEPADADEAAAPQRRDTLAPRNAAEAVEAAAIVARRGARVAVAAECACGRKSRSTFTNSGQTRVRSFRTVSAAPTEGLRGGTHDVKLTTA